MASKYYKDDLKLTTRQTERLIEYYRAERGLWDVTSPTYFKKEHRKRALQRIAVKLTEEYGFMADCTGTYADLPF